MSDIYRIIAYKHERVDTCRGCVMDRWPSEFENVTANNRNSAIQQIAEFLASGFKYENIVIARALTEDEEWNEDEWFRYPAIDLADKLRIEAVAAQKEREEKEQQERARKAQEANEKRERSEFERLKAKYGN